jgi:hypothetical protein
MVLIKSQLKFTQRRGQNCVTDSLSSQTVLFISNAVRMQSASLIKPASSKQYLYSLQLMVRRLF